MKRIFIFLKKTPHPSRFARHLLPLSRRRRPRSLARIGQFPAGEGWQNALPPSAHPPYPRPPTYICGRADNACTNLLGYFVRYVRTRGIAEAVGSGKTTDFRFATVPHILATHGSRD